MATVKGDVHDIGKNIVGVVLQCNGYEIDGSRRDGAVRAHLGARDRRLARRDRSVGSDHAIAR
jgi:hypothetical protein